MPNRLRQLRRQLKVTQMGLSVKTRVSPATIVAIERYGYCPGGEVRSKLADALGTSEGMIWTEIER